MRGLAAAVVWVVALRPAAPSPTDAIGRDVGMDRSQRVPEHEGARIMRDAEDGRPEHLYFAALLYLYGKGGVAESPAEAVRASPAVVARAAARGAPPPPRPHRSRAPPAARRGKASRFMKYLDDDEAGAAS